MSRNTLVLESEYRVWDGKLRWCLEVAARHSGLVTDSSTNRWLRAGKAALAELSAAQAPSVDRLAGIAAAPQK